MPASPVETQILSISFETVILFSTAHMQLMTHYSRKWYFQLLFNNYSAQIKNCLGVMIVYYTCIPCECSPFIQIIIVIDLNNCSSLFYKASMCRTLILGILISHDWNWLAISRKIYIFVFKMYIRVERPYILYLIVFEKLIFITI